MLVHRFIFPFFFCKFFRFAAEHGYTFLISPCWCRTLILVLETFCGVRGIIVFSLSVVIDYCDQIKIKKQLRCVHAVLFLIIVDAHKTLPLVTDC